MEVLFNEVVKLPFPMTYKQIEIALYKSSPENFFWGLPDEDGQVVGSQIQLANYGAEFFAKSDRSRLREDESYSEIFVVNNEGFGDVVRAINDGPGHDEAVVEFCKNVVRDFIAECQKL